MCVCPGMCVYGGCGAVVELRSHADVWCVCVCVCVFGMGGAAWGRSVFVEGSTA